MASAYPRPVVSSIAMLALSCLVILVVPGCVRKLPPAQPDVQAAPDPVTIAPAPPVAAVGPAPGPVVVEPLEDVPETFMPVFREPGVVRIGFLAPLSGPRAPLGTAWTNEVAIAPASEGESVLL